MAGLVTLLVLAPILALVMVALEGSTGLWPHLLASVLPAALGDTVILLAGIGTLTAVIGTSCAWLVTAYDFRGRRILDWALLLPLAVPAYIVAYAYLDILHPVGPVQTALRAMLGIASPRDFRLPDIRSMWGCILVLSFVLYPYVYLTTRALFLMQAAGLIEVSRTLGAGRGRVFLHVALPLARPAIAVGVSLAMMEALNDIGAATFLSVNTLTVTIYNTWVNRTDLPGAAQIALIMLLVVVVLLALERWARRRQRYASSAGQAARPIAPRPLHGAAGLAALALGSVPVLLGFMAPAWYLVAETVKRIRFAGVSQQIVDEVWNTLSLSVTATFVALACGLAVAYAARLVHGPWILALARLSTVGYAVPGTVLAIGLLGPVVFVDGLIDDVSRVLTGIPTGLLLLGSGSALVYAYVARFLAVSVGGIEAGFSRIPTSLDAASRMLGSKAGRTLRLVHLPLARPALASAALLVFVDCMKELPATLLLRPLNFETLATHLYGEAARGTYEEAAIAALLIVIAGLLPVILLARVSRMPTIAPGRQAVMDAIPVDGDGLLATR